MLSLAILPLAILPLALAIYNYLIYPLFISPLSRIPAAHWSTPISPLWILHKRFHNLENRTLHAAHLNFGPIIRIGPNELSVNDLSGLRTVYGGGFEKGDWYSLFDNYGVPNMFSTAPTRPHSTRKRILSYTYSKSTIQTSLPLHAQSHALLFTRLLPLLFSTTTNPSPSKSISKSKTAPMGINIHEIYSATTMDFTTTYLFGLSASSNFLQDVVYRKHWLGLYHARHAYTFFPQQIPFVTGLLKKVGVYLVPQHVEAANGELEEWCLGLCRKAFDYLEQLELAGGELERWVVDEPVVLKAMVDGIAKGQRAKGDDSVGLEGLNLMRERELDIASEMLDHLAAGFETSGIILTYITYHLSLNLPLQSLLRTELQTLGPGLLLSNTNTANAIPAPKTLDTLPLLHAILLETLRLNAAIPGNQPRVSPACVIDGYEVPRGTVVGAQAYSVHRNEKVYGGAGVWDYRRWLEADDVTMETLKERGRNLWAFGSGGRMCVGSHFAVHEIKLVIAAIYTNFTTHIVDDAGIEQEDGYVAGPVGNRLMVRFEQVSDGTSNE